MNRFRAASLARPLATCLMLGLLAACGQTTQRAAVTRAPVSTGQWAHPGTYDAPGPSHDPWGPYISQASRRFDIPERWIREVMRQESAGRVGATSRVGAMGLMQVMPGTYAELRSRYGLGTDPYHPWDSLMAGTAYLREMYDLYGSPAFLAAYNAGPRRLEDYLWSSRGLPAETRNYVARIGPRIVDASPNRRAAPEVYAAAEIPLNIPAGPRRGDTATMLALREQRNAIEPGIQVASLPPGPVVRMDPIPDGSSQSYSGLSYSPSAYGQSTQLASAGGVIVSQAAAAAPSSAPAGSVIAMAPIASLDDFQTRMEPIRSPGDGMSGTQSGSIPPATTMEPIRSPGDGLHSTQLASVTPSTTMAPIYSAGDREARMEPVVNPGDRPMSGPVGAPLIARESLTPPPPSAPAWAAPRRDPPARAPQMLAARDVPATPASPFVRVYPPGMEAPASPARRGFSFIPQAQASTLPADPRRAGAAASAGGNWSIQVGAFASANLARAASGQARSQVGTAGTRAQVQPVSQGRSTLYRARVQGLADRDAAEQACRRMRGTACMVVAPGA